MAKKEKNTTARVQRIVIALLLAALLVESFYIVKLHRAADAPAQAAPEYTVAAEPESTPVSQTGESAEQTEPAEPTDPQQPAPDAAEQILQNMTLHEKICQLFLVAPSNITGVTYVTAAGEATRQALAEYPVGGLFYNRTNMVSKEQVQQMLQTVQTYSEIPLILTCDEEGGEINRLMDTIGTTYVGDMLDYKDDGAETARKNAQTIASDMRDCGFNLDFAPVADVWSNPDNKVIGKRAYSDDFAQAAELIPAAVEGFHAGGVACTLKHFPGHGDTKTDSHYGDAYVTKSLDELRQQEFLPFAAGIEAGADAVMLGHLTVTDVDEVPAPLSYKLVTEILRQELGFEGVVITDDLSMLAIANRYTTEEFAVGAIQAGVDMLLCPTDLDAAIGALETAVQTGELTEQRIDESVLRILRLKQSLGLLTAAE